MDYKNGMEILTEGNIYDIDNPFQRSNLDVNHNLTEGIAYTRILKTVIKNENEYYKEFYDIDILDTGRSSSDVVNYFNLFLRISKDESTVRYSHLLDVKLSEGTPSVYLVAREEESGKCIEVYIKTHYSNSRISTHINLAEPNNCKDNLLSEYKYYNNEEFEQIQNNAELFEEVNQIKTYYSELEVKNVLRARFNVNIEGNLNLYKNVGINGNVNIGSVNNKLSNLYVKNIMCYDGVRLAPMSSKPTENLYDGLTIFHNSTKKIMTYWQGNWYDAGGNIV